jgi:hypothetical protein
MKEEVLSASFPAYGTQSGQRDFEPGDTPRYGAGANIENHPQVTDFVPRRYHIIGLIGLLVVAIGFAAELAAHFASSLSELTGVLSGDVISTLFADRLTAWTSAALLLTTACYARLVFSLRRHRVDDYRGRYRIWKIAVWASIALSLNAVVSLHRPAASVLGHYSGWNLLPNHVGWWLVPATLLGGWLIVKLAFDAAECRTALLSYCLAIASFGIAAASSLGWSPALLADFPGILDRVLPLAAHLFLLTGTMLYARYVVLDVQGLIEHREIASEKAAEVRISEEMNAETQEPSSMAVAQKSSEDGQWVDGSEPETNDEAATSRRLSKAERKRLRKQKQRDRAA